MPICNPSGVRNKFSVVRCESSIAYTRLSKCHNLNILESKIDLQNKKNSPSATNQHWQKTVSIIVDQLETRASRDTDF